LQRTHLHCPRLLTIPGFNVTQYKNVRFVSYQAERVDWMLRVHKAIGLAGGWSDWPQRNKTHHMAEKCFYSSNESLAR